MATLDTNVDSRKDSRWWSTEMDRVFGDHVHVPVQRDAKAAKSDRLVLGIPFKVVREKVIDYGRCDFSEEYQDVDTVVSAADRVLLYCYLNMRGHFWSSHRPTTRQPESRRERRAGAWFGSGGYRP